MILLIILYKIVWTVVIYIEEAVDTCISDLDVGVSDFLKCSSNKQISSTETASEEWITLKSSAIPTSWAALTY